jgi:hypothetical protein
LLIMNRGIFRQSELKKSGREFAGCLVVAVSDVDELKFPAKAIANAFRFREHLKESRRKRAGYSYGPVGWIDHFARLLCGLRLDSASVMEKWSEGLER